MSGLSRKLSCPGGYLTVLSCHSKTSKRRKTNISLEPIGFGKQMFRKKNSTVDIFPLVCWGVITRHPNRKRETMISRAGLNRLAAAGKTR